MFYKYLPQNKHLAKLKSLPLESFSYTKLIDEPSILHSHVNCEIVVPLNSYGYLVANEEKYYLKENQIVVINPNEMHTEKNLNQNGEKLEYFSLRLTTSIENNREPIVFLKNKTANENMIWYLKKAYEFLVEDGNEELANLNLSSFFLLFIKEASDNGLYALNVSNNKMPSFIKDAQNFIKYNYGKSISVASLAKKYNICETLFCNKFSKYVGMTPKKYINKVRIETSMHLLLTTNHSISQISMLCGFKSPAYFTKTFREHTNILPKFYREAK